VILPILFAASYSVLNTDIEVAHAVFNDAGVIAGKRYSKGSPSGYQCFVWDHSRMTRLPDEITEVAGVNAKGQVAVITRRGAAIWFAGKLTFPDADFRGGQPVGISYSGQLIGWVSTGSEGVYQVAVWPKAATVTNHFGPPRPAAVAPDGAFVGNLNQGRQSRLTTPQLGWMWLHNKAISLGDSVMQTTLTCISPLHRVGGSCISGQTRYNKPFVWSNGVLTSLPLPSDVDSYGLVVGVNDRDEAVGEIDWQAKIVDGTANYHKVAYWHGGKLSILDDLLPADRNIELVQVYGINGKGQILASAQSKITHWPRKLVILTPR
jgi:hypothetical protein